MDGGGQQLGLQYVLDDQPHAVVVRIRVFLPPYVFSSISLLPLPFLGMPMCVAMAPYGWDDVGGVVYSLCVYIVTSASTITDVTEFRRILTLNICFVFTSLHYWSICLV